MAALNRGSMDLSASAVLAASRTSMPVLQQQVNIYIYNKQQSGNLFAATSITL